MNIRQIINYHGNYSQINREERNLSAIFFLVLNQFDNIDRFLEYLGFHTEIGSEFGIYFEYAFLRDLWKTVSDNSIKKEIIRQYLRLGSIDEILDQPIIEINKIFGVAGRISKSSIQSPRWWSINKYSDHFSDNSEFLDICRFKWSFNIKPDIVIHLDRKTALCIEAKLESRKGQYPKSGSVDKKIFDNRGLTCVDQLELQKFMMEDILGLNTEFILLVKQRENSNTHRVVHWKEIFTCLDLSGLPGYGKELIRNIVCVDI